MESRITLGSEFVRKACQTIDCTVARVFFTRWFSSSMSMLGLGQLLLVLGEINERGKMLNNITVLIPDRADEEGGPELAAILAAVKNLRAAVRATLEFAL